MRTSTPLRLPTAKADDQSELEGLIARELELLGEDPAREGLLRTPHRVAEAMSWMTRGYAMGVEDVVNGAVFRETHEHHMLPFFGKIHIAYIPNGKIIDLSKLPRIVEIFARRISRLGAPTIK